MQFVASCLRQFNRLIYIWAREVFAHLIFSVLMFSVPNMCVSVAGIVYVMFWIRRFRDDLATYLVHLCRKTKPKCIIACMLYFLDEHATGSWADPTLNALGFDLKFVCT